MRRYSAAARQRVTEPWEECLLFVYDDKVPKRKISGRWQYPEWDGGPVRGTLTIGFGHTDAAGGLKISQGLKLTREQADELLSADLAPCERAVDRMLSKDASQHQFDGLVDTYFNCPSAAIAAAKLVNAGRADEVPAKLLQYVNSRGERMQGLVNRRQAEITWFNHPDDAPAPAPVAVPDPDIVQCPKGERNDPPKSMAQSKTGNAALSLGAASLYAMIQKAQDVLAQLQDMQGQFVSLGLGDQLSAIAHSPAAMFALAGVGLAAFIWFDRRHKLVNDHV